MPRITSMIATAVLLLGADASGTLRVSASPKISNSSPDQTIASFDNTQADNQPHSSHDDPLAGKGLPGKTKDEPLQPDSRLALVRFVDGEFARVVVPLPAGKNGFHFKAGVPLDEKQLRMALGAAGPAANPGDSAQITGLQFKDREIVVDVNGGGRGKKRRIRDHIHMEIGSGPTMNDPIPDVPVEKATGSTLYLEFDKDVPDMTPEDLKHLLSGLLDFSKQHSAAVQWIDTLPADIQQAISDKRAAVGMDREMVVAAVGRPDRKVREKTSDGGETEDWIYGTPPAKTIFITFEGEKVTKVRQFPQ